MRTWLWGYFSSICDDTGCGGTLRHLVYVARCALAVRVYGRLLSRFFCLERPLSIKVVTKLYVFFALSVVVGWLCGETEHDEQVMTTLIPSFTAVIAALNISLGADVGGFFLETIAKELNAEVCRVGRECARVLSAFCSSDQRFQPQLVDHKNRDVNGGLDDKVGHKPITLTLLSTLRVAYHAPQKLFIHMSTSS